MREKKVEISLEQTQQLLEEIQTYKQELDRERPSFSESSKWDLADERWSVLDNQDDQYAILQRLERDLIRAQTIALAGEKVKDSTSAYQEAQQAARVRYEAKYQLKTNRDNLLQAIADVKNENSPENFAKMKAAKETFEACLQACDNDREEVTRMLKATLKNYQVAQASYKEACQNNYQHSEANLQNFLQEAQRKNKSFSQLQVNVTRIQEAFAKVKAEINKQPKQAAETVAIDKQPQQSVVLEQAQEPVVPEQAQDEKEKKDVINEQEQQPVVEAAAIYKQAEQSVDDDDDFITVDAPEQAQQPAEEKVEIDLKAANKLRRLVLAHEQHLVREMKPSDLHTEIVEDDFINIDRSKEYETFQKVKRTLKLDNIEQAWDAAAKAEIELEEAGEELINNQAVLGRTGGEFADRDKAIERSMKAKKSAQETSTVRIDVTDFKKTLQDNRSHFTKDSKGKEFVVRALKIVAGGIAIVATAGLAAAPLYKFGFFSKPKGKEFVDNTEALLTTASRRPGAASAA